MNQQERAIAYINNAIDQELWKPGDRLPSLKELGNDIGVSYFTMVKAVRRLAKENRLSIAPRSGTRVSTPTEFLQQPITGHEEKWRKIRKKIVDDLFNRSLNISNPLPSMQELCQRYGVSYPILKKALCSLEEEGLLISYKRTYKPSLFSKAGHKTKLLLLFPICPDNINKNGATYEEKGFLFYGRGSLFLQAFERLCTIQNFSFEIWGYSHKDNVTTYYSPDLSPCHSIGVPNAYFGIFLIKFHLFNPGFSMMISRIAGIGVPIAIFEGSDELHWPVPRTKEGAVRVFHIAVSDLSGQKVGQYLLQHGHRKIAYLSPWFKDGWTINRYSGLQKAFGMFSDPKAVNLFVDRQYAIGSIHLKDNMLDAKFEQNHFLEEMLKVSQGRPGMKEIDLVSEISTIFRRNIEHFQIEIFMKPLFKKALAKKNITAWVCADDRIALFALRFLHANGIDVPKRISVVGFEDTLEAYTACLSSYNYDLPGIIQTMLAYISNPDFFPASKGIFIEKNGFFVQRQSSGEAP